MNTTGVEFTAGLGGFLVLFGLALAVWFLGRDLTRRLRRMRQREELRLEQELSGEAGQAGGAGEQPGDDAPGQQPPPGDRD